jgi:hypothetical protein
LIHKINYFSKTFKATHVRDFMVLDEG